LKHELLTLSGTEQGRLLARGELSSIELIQAHLNHIEKVNPRLNAAVEVLRETAIAGAAEADARRRASKSLGALDGVPFSVKDSIEIRGTVCSAGTLGRKNAATSVTDATLVARLRGAGAIPIARTNLPDLLFAFESDNLLFGATKNPYDFTRSAGGSSGGEAALIAACGSPFGLGSDAAGSIRLPAHYCGITSLKPTQGRLPRTGHVPAAGGWLEMIWQIGPMARRVEDLCSLMPVLSGADGQDRSVIPVPYGRPTEVNLKKLRVAFFVDNGIAAADAETADVVRRAALALTPEVALVEERTPPGMEASYELEMKMIGPDGGDGLRAYLREIGSTRTHPMLDGWLAKLEAYRTDLAGFASYWAELDRFRNSMFRFLTEFDVVLSPVAAQPAVPHGHSIREEVFRGFSYTMTHNLTGWPAGVVRCGISQSGLPIGIQVAAAPWREDVVLAVLLQLERALGGWSPPKQVD